VPVTFFFLPFPAAILTSVSLAAAKFAATNKVSLITVFSTKTETIDGDCRVGEARGCAELTYEPEVGLHVVRNLRYGVSRSTMCERREEDELVREVPVDRGAGAEIGEKCARDVFTDRF
jgi:hypothetical protein